jgi:hypothetical protein
MRDYDHPASITREEFESYYPVYAPAVRKKCAIYEQSYGMMFEGFE